MARRWIVLEASFGLYVQNRLVSLSCHSVVKFGSDINFLGTRNLKLGIQITQNSEAKYFI
jgi:hypothetical protein